MARRCGPRGASGDHIRYAAPPAGGRMEVSSCRAQQATGEQQVIYYIYETGRPGRAKR